MAAGCGTNDAEDAPMLTRPNATAPPATHRNSVAITGADGTIGTLLTERLAERYDFRPLTREMADIADFEALKPHFDGIDAVVHLAASAEVDADWEPVLHNNIVGARNVYEAGLAGGVGLVVFASTNHVVGMFERDESLWEADSERPRQIGIDAPIRPDSLYGASKAWGEALGRFYAETTDLRVICLRIGWVTDDDSIPGAADDGTPDDEATQRRHRGLWLSHADCAALVAASLDAPESVRWGIVYGVSNNPGRWFSLDPGRQLLGWEPQDSEADHP
jgi:NAD+ dependent glucose-6-phosphate dehydrogenase